ncbi:MAG: repeat-containing protein [Verrucomicrobia bacterium]|jgi:hypothetical protein|nr:repeat-containing protein [Verrucomicrobiota bacterium]
MKQKSILIILLLCLPVVVLVTAVINRSAAARRQTIPVWFEQMKVMERSQNLSVLSKLGEADVPMLREAMLSSRPSQRVKAIWVLGELKAAARPAVPEMVQALYDDDAGVRANAIQALAKIGVSDQGLIPVLLPRLNDPDLGMSGSVADLLTRIEEECRTQSAGAFSNRFEYVAAFLQASSPRARLMSLPKLTKLSQEDVRVSGAYDQLLNDSNGWVREQTRVYLSKQRAAGSI